MKQLLLALLFTAVSVNDVMALPDEENLKVLIKVTSEKIFAISSAILPKDGESKTKVESLFGKPKTEYLPNPDGLRTLEYDLSVNGTENGLRTVLPCTLHVTYLKDAVVDAFLSVPHLDILDTTIRRDQIGKLNDTWQSRYLIDFKLLNMLERVKVHFDEMRTLNRGATSIP